MYEQIREDTLYIIFYSVVTAMAMIASCYLLFRDGNAFARDVTPPVRLRRWTAAFFMVFALNHVWYMPIFFLSASEDITMTDLIGGMLDSLTLFPLIIIVLLTMLQDRRRPLWPVAMMMVPFFLGSAFNAVTHSYVLLPMIYVYFLLMCIGLIIYMVRALRQYSRWLRDNYADLEHKEVWQSFAVLAVILLMFAIYAFIGQGPVCQYAMQVISAVLVCHLLWRVETLSELSIQGAQSLPTDTSLPAGQESDGLAVGSPEQQWGTVSQESLANSSALPPGSSKNIGPLLQKYCIDTQLYLQHDLTLFQLAKAVGTNRLYLSQYFSSLGMTYNAYINNLRINHFIGLYSEAVAAQRPVTAQQLAQESGFHSYRTFSDAFKRKTGQSVTAWDKKVLKWQNLQKT